MTTDQITPALTAEEWAKVSVPNPNFDDVLTGKEDEDDVFRAVALFNAALPDDDPRKITRLDVEAIEVAAEFYEKNRISLSMVSDLLSAAAKLAALLPPER